MRINEVYEHQPILPYQAENCQNAACDKMSTQCLDISLPLTVTPVAGVGTTTTACQGAPVVTCVRAPDGLTCTVTVTQRVCMTIPVRFSAVAEPTSAVIACGDTEGNCQL